MPPEDNSNWQEFSESDEPVNLSLVALPPVSIRMTAMIRAAKTSRR